MKQVPTQAIGGDQHHNSQASCHFCNPYPGCSKMFTPSKHLCHIPCSEQHDIRILLSGWCWLSVLFGHFEICLENWTTFSHIKSSPIGWACYWPKHIEHGGWWYFGVTLISTRRWRTKRICLCGSVFKTLGWASAHWRFCDIGGGIFRLMWCSVSRLRFSLLLFGCWTWKYDIWGIWNKKIILTFCAQGNLFANSNCSCNKFDHSQNVHTLVLSARKQTPIGQKTSWMSNMCCSNHWETHRPFSGKCYSLGGCSVASQG